MFRELDPVLHSQLRLAIMSILMTTDHAEFNFLKEQTQATSGNLSIQINKLKNAGYIEVKKKFKGNYPQTLCKITRLGIKKFEEYIDSLQEYLGQKK